MILNEFEALTNLANGPIIFTYYAESDLSTSTLQQLNTDAKFVYQLSVADELHRPRSGAPKIAS